MRRDSFKLLIFAAIVGFAILYGMELSSKGIADVHGPLKNAPLSIEDQAGSEGDWTLPAAGTGKRNNAPTSKTQQSAEDMPYYWDDEEFSIPRNDREPLVDRVSGKTGEVLHDLSRTGIRIVVSIFDKVLG
ncbi:hypothetical protein [Cohnella abietis]|uniref:Uncharacterized protein n=1 Tax=Cohnella abietis TaxID=2507935 RepID=A0A3T1D9I7_9BACL|nr:hypothetical protein [Cohnella abietis]BBI34762.1 hypothetical protein KCTCHS21_41610 [Cohnella abietis]